MYYKDICAGIIVGLIIVSFLLYIDREELV
jgi:hypothetical protein